MIRHPSYSVTWELLFTIFTTLSQQFKNIILSSFFSLDAIIIFVFIFRQNSPMYCSSTIMYKSPG